MGKPWQWATGWVTDLVAEAARVSNVAALDNARCAATELSRARVERDAVELYLHAALEPRASRSGAVRPA